MIKCYSNNSFDSKTGNEDNKCDLLQMTAQF